MSFITFSEKALDHLKYLYNLNNNEYIKLKLSTKGCSGQSYDLNFCAEEDINPLDEKIKLPDSFTVIMDFKSIMWLMGTHIDWVEDRFGSKFEFTSNKIGGTCGCGESFYFKNKSLELYDE
jgi:iron-sulfur cluster assembly protein